MSNGDPTTGRAQRARAVAEGSASDAVDRLIPRSDPRSNVADMPSRARQRTVAQDVAGEIDIDREGVGTIDRIGGMDVFLRGPGPSEFGANVRSDFASEAEYVEPDDVAANVDPREITAAPQIPTDRRSRVADRARREIAGEDPYAQPSDFFADVGRYGVEEAGLTDTGARTRAGRQFADETALESVGPGDVRETDEGFTLREGPQRELAAFEFADATPVDAFDPATDITPTDGGFGLTSDAQREVAARQFEKEFDLFGTGELDPATDIREVEGGYGLGEGPAAEIAAADLDAQLEDIDVTPDDITLEPTESGGFEAIFEGRR